MTLLLNFIFVESDCHRTSVFNIYVCLSRLFDVSWNVNLLIFDDVMNVCKLCAYFYVVF